MQIKEIGLMLKSLKKFLKVYPLPIFVLLLSFVIYYSAFEILRTRGTNPAPQTEADSMLNEESSMMADAIEPTKPIEMESNVAQPQEVEIPFVEESQEQQAQVEDSKVYLTTTTKSLNIRQEPNTTAAVVGKLTPADQMILVEDRVNGFS